MPLYEYDCPSHGDFTLMRPMVQSGADAPCPTCASASRRVITAPNLFTMKPLQREAACRNEKSRHEPRVCTSGCGRAKPRAADTGAAARGGARKLHSYTGPRPWVVEHR